MVGPLPFSFSSTPALPIGLSLSLLYMPLTESAPLFRRNFFARTTHRSPFRFELGSAHFHDEIGVASRLYAHAAVGYNE